MKKEEITEESPFSDTIQNITSTTEFMDPLEVVVAQVKTEKIEEDEQSTIKEELPKKIVPLYILLMIAY